MTFLDLVKQRWSEVERRLGMSNGTLSVTWEVKYGYPHFRKARGFAVCFFDGHAACHMQFSPKILRSPVHRADAIVRHEMGHAVDFLIEPSALDEWAMRQGVVLPQTPERRADAIALAVWGRPIRYDRDLVQSTVNGSTVRPEHLGL